MAYNNKKKKYTPDDIIEFLNRNHKVRYNSKLKIYQSKSPKGKIKRIRALTLNNAAKIKLKIYNPNKWYSYLKLRNIPNVL